MAVPINLPLMPLAGAAGSLCFPGVLERSGEHTHTVILSKHLQVLPKAGPLRVGLFLPKAQISDFESPSNKATTRARETSGHEEGPSVTTSPKQSPELHTVTHFPSLPREPMQHGNSGRYSPRCRHRTRAWEVQRGAHGLQAEASPLSALPVFLST